MRSINSPTDNYHHTIKDIVDHHARFSPCAVAYTYLTFEVDKIGETNITYEDLRSKAISIGAMIEDHCGKDERALILFHPGIDYICVFIGCLYAGAIAVPVYPPLSKRMIHRFKHILFDSEAKLLITDASIEREIKKKWGIVDDASSHIWLTIEQSKEYSGIKALKNDDISGDTSAFLQYTSGSTSDPKGVIVTNSNLIHNLTKIYKSFNFSPEDIMVEWLPPYHDMGLIGGILEPLFGGFRVIKIAPFDFLQKPFRWIEAISIYHGTSGGGPNFGYDLCIDHTSEEQLCEPDLSSWRVAYNGAEPINPDTIDRFSNKFERCGFKRKAFYPCYGLAEGTLFVTGGSTNAEPVIRSFDSKKYRDNTIITCPSSQSGHRMVGCGSCLNEEQISIVDPDTLTQCDSDQIGEIWIKSLSVAKGYWNKPQSTEKTFKAYLSDTGEGPYLRTGDLGVFLDGELFVSGRIKDLIIIQGSNHYPQDIERTVEQCHPALRKGCGAAFSIFDSGHEHLVVMQEVKRQYIRRIDEDEVIETIRKAIAEGHGIDTKAILLLSPGSIIKTTSGKIRRNACRRAYLETQK